MGRCLEPGEGNCGNSADAEGTAGDSCHREYEVGLGGLVALGNNWYRVNKKYPRIQAEGEPSQSAAYAEYLEQPQGF